MKKLFTVLFVAILLACASDDNDAAKSPSATLNGTWTSDVMTVTIDFNTGAYEGVGLGQEFSRKLTLIEESDDLVVFRIDDKEVVAQVLDNDNIILTTRLEDGSSGIPVRLTRQ